MATLGLGLAALGRPGYMTLGHEGDVADASASGMERTAFEVLDAAFALGVRHVDTARSYGLAEQFLARWLALRSPADVFVSSKWGYRYTAGFQRRAEVHEVKDHRLAHFEAQWAESDAVLGPALRLYQIHSLTLDSPALTDGPLLARLAQLKARGVELGASVTGPAQGAVIERLLEAQVDGVRLFGWVQATWNVLERSAGPALARAKSAGVNVIVKEALANGKLTDRGQEAALLAEAARRAVRPDALALAIALAQPFADVVLSGAATVAQLESNLGARALAGTIDADALVECAKDARSYWAERALMSWT